MRILDELEEYGDFDDIKAFMEQMGFELVTLKGEDTPSGWAGDWDKFSPALRAWAEEQLSPHCDSILLESLLTDVRLDESDYYQDITRRFREWVE